jgi:methylthioribose-1-phosphate isomerase
MEWTGECLRLLDQRELPGRESWVDCRDTETLAEAIRTLAVRGAPAIGLAAAYGAVIAALESSPSTDDFHTEVSERLDVLAGTRPTAVNLFHCIEIQKKVLAACSSREEAVSRLLTEAEKLFQEDLEASRAMGRFGADLLKPGCRILTHCNAGGLATSGLGTALAVVYEAWDRGLLRKVFADETRPLLQGGRLTSWELSRAGIPVEVLPDSAASMLIRSGEVDAVITGSDRIVANGDAANKIGTYALSLAAAAHRVPFYVVAPLSTFDMTTPSGEEIVIEMRDREELSHFCGERILPEGVAVYNPAFDVTPFSNITAIICERGVIFSSSELKDYSG